MLALLLLQLLGWMVVIGTFLVLLDRLGTFRGRERFSEESMTRLWGSSGQVLQGQEAGND